MMELGRESLKWIFVIRKSLVYGGRNAYVLTDEPVPRGLLQVVEADGLQLLLMQKEAYSTLLAESSCD